MSIPITNIKGYENCKECNKNDGGFESHECLNCFNNPLLKDNFEPKED